MAASALAPSFSLTASIVILVAFASRVPSFAAADPGHSNAFSCDPSTWLNSTCTSNEKGRIGDTLISPDASTCCALCMATQQCQSFTYWDNKCNIFKDAAGFHAGDCVSGTGGVVPPPPPSPWIPPPAIDPTKICKDCPNIIFSLTDDQDVLLGGWDPMEKTKAMIEKTGATLVNWRIHTPICSPSRSETVSGRYFHNIKSDIPVPPPHVLPAATAHINSTLYLNKSFGVLLREQRGYQVGLFGKSNFNTMEGFDRWFEGAYLGYGGTWQDSESPDFKYKANSTTYATSLLGNKTIEWLGRENVTGDQNQGRPFFVYFAPHCPHIPSTPAEWYADACVGVKAPRIPSYNFSSPFFHELIAKQPPFTVEEETDIDTLARLRCQCLLSVDDAHAALMEELGKLGVANNTYWFISSDHGYNLGNHRLPSNKFLLYDHSLRIPMVANGPGIAAGSQNPVMGTNVDYAPTWLGLADIDTPEYMDGKSIVPYLIPKNTTAVIPGATRRHLEKQRELFDGPNMRTEQFFQYYNQGPWHPNDPKDGLGRWLDDYSNTYIGIMVDDPSFGSGLYKYGEYQYVCNATQFHARTCFQDIQFYELFDMSVDPYELNNIYNSTSASMKDELHSRLHTHYGCQGTSCP